MGQVVDRGADPLGGQPLHHVDEPVVDPADDVLDRHPDIGEESSEVSASGCPTLSQLAAALETGHAGLDGEQGDAARLFSGLVRAATSTRSAEYPFVMKVLDPFTIQSSLSRAAVVLRAARSEPPEGSVMPMAVIELAAAELGQPPPLLLLGA